MNHYICRVDRKSANILALIKGYVPLFHIKMQYGQKTTRWQMTLNTRWREEAGGGEEAVGGSMVVVGFPAERIPPGQRCSKKLQEKTSPFSAHFHRCCHHKVRVKKRPELEDDYVFFFRERLYDTYQIQRPEKESSDKHLKNGDVNDEQPEGPRGYFGMGAVSSASCVVMTNLALSDFSFSLTLPLRLHYYFSGRVWTFSDWLCRLYVYASTSTCTRGF
ncbi:hypothetical protein F7725_005075 [Dissostichus mawsoni]|uniref:Uncharacterized protein n=1 Tax=Dissostichus mawsoni TaxID=36200 RepID=A0A7J5XKX6_DISMA|nr:hypothetical protein F7725_005075 [Dissostichus mawsoni]